MVDNKSNNIVTSSDLIWLLNAILKNWYLFLILIPLFTVLGLIYNHKQLKQYNTKIEILLKSNDVYDYQENLYNNLGFYNYYGDISNQRRILGSYDMMKNVLSKLDLSCSYYIVGRSIQKNFLMNCHLKLVPRYLTLVYMKHPLILKS